MKTFQRCWHLAIFLGGLLFFLQPNPLHGQCTNAPSGDFPDSPVTLNSDNTTTTVTTCAYTGEYSVVTNVQAGK